MLPSNYGNTPLIRRSAQMAASYEQMWWFDMVQLNSALISWIKSKDIASFQVNLDIHPVTKDPTLSNSLQSVT